MHWCIEMPVIAIEPQGPFDQNDELDRLADSPVLPAQSHKLAHSELLPLCPLTHVQPHDIWRDKRKHSRRKLCPAAAGVEVKDNGWSRKWWDRRERGRR